MAKINRKLLEREILRDIESLFLSSQKPSKKTTHTTSKKVLSKKRKISRLTKTKFVSRKGEEGYIADQVEIVLSRSIEASENFDQLIDDLMTLSIAEIKKMRKRKIYKFTLGLVFSFKNDRGEETFRTTFSKRFHSIKIQDIQKVLDDVFADEFKQKFIAYIMNKGDSRIMIHSLIIEGVKDNETTKNKATKR